MVGNAGYWWVPVLMGIDGELCATRGNGGNGGEW